MCYGWKNTALEEFCLSEVTKHCRRLSIRLSKWNCQVGFDNIVLRVREPYSEEARTTPEKVGAWKHVLMSSDKCELLACNDASAGFSLERREGTVSHLNLFLLIRTYPHMFDYYSFSDSLSEEELLVQETLEKFLRLTRLFAFCD